MLKKNDVEAQCFLGSFYEFGWYVEADIKKAMELYKKASDQGYGLASNNLGSIYQKGWSGCSANGELAEQWFKKAREQGFIHAPKHTK